MTLNTYSPQGKAHFSGSDIANGPPHLDFRVFSPTFAGIRWPLGFGRGERAVAQKPMYAIYIVS